MDLSALPRGDLIEKGLGDLALGVESVEALLVAVGAPRLRRAGLAVPEQPTDVAPEHRLYALLAREDPDSAHSRYNALVRRLVSLERALERARPAEAALLQALMRALGAESRRRARAYLTGGATAVLVGWRTATRGVDLVFEPEDDGLLRALPRVKEELEINIELASPAQFIPELPGWKERSPFVERDGLLDFHHYDPYAQALAKIERGHSQDVGDVRALLERGLVEPARLRQLFEAIRPELFRFPAIDPPAFERALEAALA